ncbi:MAG: 6-phosphogluconolactonase [bacterium]|nr:6-phosphogluconolactonase [bacterium]
MNIITDKENIKEKAGKALDAMMRERNGKELLVLLSGGSSLQLLDYVSDEALMGGVTLGMLDDRYSHDPSVNSYSILAGGGFYMRAMDKGAVFLDSSVGQTESLENYAERYEGYIKEWMNMYPDGIIRATVGIGPDGHTSGILPHPENPQKFEGLFNGEHFVVGYDVENKNPHRYRLTSTFTLMKKFDQVLTFMTGENKKEALQKVIAEEGILAETPGRVVRELKDVTIYTNIEI